MHIEQCKYFIEICKQKYNITKASKNIQISQPALSKMIRTMESELGVEIFRKHKGKFIGLTNEGKIVLDYCQQAVDLYYRFRYRLEGTDEGYKPHIRIGISSYILDILFSDSIQALYDRQHYQLDFVEAYGNELLLKFMKDEFDILLMLESDAELQYSCQVTRLLSCPFVAVVHKQHELAFCDKIQWKQLNHMQIAIPSKDNQVHNQIMDQLNKELIFPDRINCISSSNALLRMAADHDYIAILPMNFYEKYRRGLEVVAIPFESELFWNMNMYIRNETLSQIPILHEVSRKIMEIVHTVQGNVSP